jgi:DNA repair ATPase RecN
MTKEQLKKELLEKVQAGIKPSQLRKLKRSKSADDLNPNPSPNNNPPPHLLQDQLSEKQKEIESLRQQLETVNHELKETKEQLDNSLQARVEGVKVFGQEHDQRTKAQKELNEIIEEASSELITSDDKVSQLKRQLHKVKTEKEELARKLKLERIKQGTHPDNSDDDLSKKLSYLKYALYSLLVV